VADAGGLDLDAGLTGARPFLDEIDHFERSIGLVEDGGFHGDLLFGWS
jgi:hypothetical protein